MSETDIDSKSPKLKSIVAERFHQSDNTLKPSLIKTRANPLQKIIAYFTHAITQSVQDRRLLIAQPFALISGMLAYRLPIYEPALPALIAGAVLLSLALYIWRHATAAIPVILLLMGFWVGVCLLPVHGKLFGTEMVYGAFYGQFSARVDAIHSKNSERARIIISEIVPVDERNAPPIRRARVLLPTEQLPQVGDIISAPMRLYRVPGPVVPGGFDSQFHAYFDGIGAFGSTTGKLEITHSLESMSFARGIQDLRDNIGKRIDTHLMLPLSGIARALIVGDQGQVDETIRANLAASGLAHVLAISGLHLSLVAGGVFSAIRMLLAGSLVLGQRINVKKTAAIGGMIAALIYLGLSGASVSAIRATLMLLLIFGAVLVGRRALTMRNVAFAALFVILTDPASIFRPSFQLSFAAVTALVGVYEGYRPRYRGQSHWGKNLLRTLSGIALTSLIAGAATALFAAYHFQQVAPLGMFGNIVAIPLVGLVILPSALIAVLTMPFGLEGVFFISMGWGIEQIINVAAFIAALSPNFISAPILEPVALMIGLLTLGWFAFFTGKIRFLSIGLAAILLPIFGTISRPDIMIADTTQAIALRNGNVLELVAGRQNSFAVRAWSETYIQTIQSTSVEAPCDSAGCYFVRPDYEIALVKSRAAFIEDCPIANLVITRQSAPGFCRLQTQVIDADDLQSKGVHWAKWMGGYFWIRPAITDVNRPWRPQYP